MLTATLNFHRQTDAHTHTREREREREREKEREKEKERGRERKRERERERERKRKRERARERERGRETLIKPLPMLTATRNFHIDIIECPQHKPHMSNMAFGYDEKSSTPQKPLFLRKSTIHTYHA